MHVSSPLAPDPPHGRASAPAPAPSPALRLPLSRRLRRPPPSPRSHAASPSSCLLVTVSLLVLCVSASLAPVPVSGAWDGLRRWIGWSATADASLPSPDLPSGSGSGTREPDAPHPVTPLAAPAPPPAPASAPASAPVPGVPPSRPAFESAYGTSPDGGLSHRPAVDGPRRITARDYGFDQDADLFSMTFGLQYPLLRLDTSTRTIDQLIDRVRMRYPLAFTRAGIAAEVGTSAASATGRPPARRTERVMNKLPTRKLLQSLTTSSTDTGVAPPSSTGVASPISTAAGDGRSSSAAAVPASLSSTAGSASASGSTASAGGGTASAGARSSTGAAWDSSRGSAVTGPASSTGSGAGSASSTGSVESVPTKSCGLVSSLDSYTLSDWLRWDSYDLSYTYAVPSRNTDTAGSPPDVAYRQLVQHQFAVNTLQTLYAWYTRSLTTKNFLRDLTVGNWFGASDVQMNVSISINLAYNRHRCTRVQVLARSLRADASVLPSDEYDVERRALLLFHSESVDFLGLPGIGHVASWLQTYLEAAFAIQKMDHGPASPTESWDAFGYFADKNGYGVGFSRRTHFFRAAAMARLTTHNLHLLPSSYIASLRPRFRAMLSALVTQEAASSPGEHSTAQWLLHIEAWALTAHALKHSERLLRERGAWSDSLESPTTDAASGAWRTGDAIAAAEQRLDAFVARLTSTGPIEFLSDYYNVQLLCLGSIMQHAASQRLYGSAEFAFVRLWQDMALHMTPFSGSLSGPTGRHYDLFSGAHAALDAFDLPLFVAPAFAPGCAQSWSRSLTSNPDMAVSFAISCPSPTTPTMLPVSANPTADMQRALFAAFQAAGWAPLPRPILEQLNLRMPRRVVEQRFTALGGQERYSFIDTAAGFQMGHAGEDVFFVASNNLHVCRLGGAPTPGAPTLFSWAGPTYHLSYIRLLAENNDRPFSAVGHQAGERMQVQARSVTTQFQHVMLITQLLAAQWWFTDAEALQAPWNSNLVAPLAARAIWADDARMPIARGSSVAVPSASILVVQHGGNCFGARLVSAERSNASRIVDATVAQNVPLQSSGQGQHPFLVTWQVDAESVQTGSGRFVVHHKHAGIDTTYQPYRVVWLWAVVACGDGDDGRRAFQAQLRTANVVQQLQTDGTWDPTKQPRNTPPPPFPWYWGDPVGAATWTVTAEFGGRTLRVRRRDVYQPMRHATIYKTPVDAPLHGSPYWVDQMSRQVDGREQLQWTTGQDAQRAQPAV